MKLKKLAAATVAAMTLTAATVAAPMASAQSTGSQDLFANLSSGSSDSSSAPVDNMPEDPINPGFEPGTPGVTSSGSSPIDTGLFLGGISLGVALIAKLVTDNSPALRKQVDQLAKQIGLQGSSGSSKASRMNGGLDFDLERLARTNGMTDLANQIAALKASSSVG